MKLGRNPQLLIATFAPLVISVVGSRHMSAEQGPPNGLGVQVLNVPLPVTGSATVSGTVAATQSGPWSVGLVQTPFFQSSTPTCDFGNRCFVTFPVVPAGKRLRVTRIHGVMFTSSDAFAALDLDIVSHPLFLQPVTHFGAAYLSFVLSFNEATDVVFEAGQTPILEIGTGGAFPVNANNRLGITGELLTVLP